MEIKDKMKTCRWFLLFLTFCSSFSLATHATAGFVQKGLKVDATNNETITFTVPVSATSVQETWIQVITDPAITPVSFEIGRVGDPLFPLPTPPVVVTINDLASFPLADATFQHNTSGTPNVFTIKLDYGVHGRTITSGSPETWQLKINNGSSFLAIFAVYIGDSEAETHGANIWLRDNATVDPSGHHTLGNINNLDVSKEPTPHEYWKSPAIRFTTNLGIPTKNPVGGETNNVYVKVRNWGTTALSSAVVEVYWANASSGLPAFPSVGWNPLGTNSVSNIDPGRWKETGAFSWPVPPKPSPGSTNHFCVFARVLSSAGPLDPVDYTSTNTNVITKTNTNATHRNVVILDVAEPPPGGPMPVFFSLTNFFISNPTEEPIYTGFRINGLPTFMRASEIKFNLSAQDKIQYEGLRPISGVKDSPQEVAHFRIVNPKRVSLSGVFLQPEEQRPVELRFGLAERVSDVKNFPIDVVQTVNNQEIGGMTYLLEFKRKAIRPFPWGIVYIAGSILVVCGGLYWLLRRRKKA